jgi:ankyrin repeat protein
VACWDSRTSLASEYGHLPVVEALLAAGANKDAKALGGYTALFMASQNGHLAVVQALLAAGSDKHAGRPQRTLHG